MAPSMTFSAPARPRLVHTPGELNAKQDDAKAMRTSWCVRALNARANQLTAALQTPQTILALTPRLLCTPLRMNELHLKDTQGALALHEAKANHMDVRIAKFGQWVAREEQADAGSSSSSTSGETCSSASWSSLLTSSSSSSDDRSRQRIERMAGEMAIIKAKRAAYKEARERKREAFRTSPEERAKARSRLYSLPAREPPRVYV